MQYSSFLVLLLFLELASVQEVKAQNIEFLTSPGSSSCAMTDTNPATVYIVVNTFGEGIQGVEFSVKGFPSDGHVIELEPSPDANVVIGNPFQGGANIAFASCQTDPVVVLYKVTLIQISGERLPFTAGIYPHDTPSNMNFDCQLVNRCDDPIYTAVCVPGGATYDRPRSPVPSNPVPADGSEDVSLSPVLSADYVGPTYCCEYISSYSWKTIYFGTDPDPPLVEEGYPGYPPTQSNPYRPGELQADTQYYWRVGYAPANSCISELGPIWKFKTTKSTAVDRMGWDAVKKRYRE